MVENSTSKIEHSMMHLVNEASVTNITANMTDKQNDPLKRLKSKMP